MALRALPQVPALEHPGPVVPDAAVSGERGTQDSNLESPVLETDDTGLDETGAFKGVS